MSWDGLLSALTLVWIQLIKSRDREETGGTTRCTPGTHTGETDGKGTPAPIPHQSFPAFPPPPTPQQETLGTGKRGQDWVSSHRAWITL